MDAVPQLIDSLPEAQFCFVPMSQHPTVPHHNDLLLARQLQARSQRLTVLEGWHHPADVMALFGHFTVAVCMRYHSLLFAGCNGIPIVPIPYAEKCADWVQEHGIVPAELTTESLVERVSQALAQARGVGCGERRR
jgi:polysaccharide pyruvyl transferase WcaK-like protein